MSTITQIREVIQRVLTDQADQIGRETGFILRKRKLSGSSWLQALVFGFQSKPTATYAELSQSAAAAGVSISPQGIEQRLNKASGDFLKAILECMVGEVLASQPTALPLLNRFEGIYIRDSSVVKLPGALQTIWRGVGSKRGENAAVKLQVCLEYSRGEVRGPILQDGRMHDQFSPYQGAELPVGALELADLGFFNLKVLSAQDRRGIYWIMRLKTGICLYDIDGNPIELLTWLHKQSTPQGEVAIQLGNREHLDCRLLFVRVTQEVAEQRRRRLRETAEKKGLALSQESLALAAWTLVITNVPAELLTLHEALVFLGVRWQIELLFKLWKSHAQIDQWKSQNPWRVLCEFYAKLIGLVISHWIMRIGIWQSPGRSLVKAYKVIQRFSLALLVTLSLDSQFEWILTRLLQCLATASLVNKRQKRPATFQRLSSSLSLSVP
jgi:hypothetical protein